MDEIEDCFVKFYLSQAVEVEPATIQAMIDHGYKSKISLLAIDLVHDLPRITEFSMAQRSILRRYISALQEFSPFTLSIDDNALQKYQEPSKPNKKRKLEAVEPDSSDESDYETAMNSGLSNSSLSPRGRPSRVNKVAHNRNSLTSSNQIYDGISMPISPMKHRRVSIKYSAAERVQDERASNNDVEMGQEESEAEVEVKPTRAGRGTAKKKKEVARTASQIRHERIKRELELKQAATSPSANGDEDDDETEDNLSTPSTPVFRAVKSTNGRKSVAPPSSSSSSIVPTRRRATIAVKTEKNAAVSEVRTATPAELEIRARIEAKKALGSKAKTTRRARASTRY